METETLSTQTGAKRRQKARAFPFIEQTVPLLSYLVPVPRTLGAELVDSITETPEWGLRLTQLSTGTSPVPLPPAGVFSKRTGVHFSVSSLPSELSSGGPSSGPCSSATHALWPQRLTPPPIALADSSRTRNLVEEQTWLWQMTTSCNSSKQARLSSHSKALFGMWQGYL